MRVRPTCVAALLALAAAAAPAAASGARHPAGPTASAWLGGRTLSRGMHGPDVAQLQMLLDEHNFNVFVNGDFGASTVAAVKRVQRGYNLIVTGTADALTLAALHAHTEVPESAPATEMMRARLEGRVRLHAAAGKSSRPLQLGARTLGPGMSGPDVQQLQLMLRQRGFSVSADGLFGAKTEAAIRRAQAAYHLKVDGLVGPKTLGALRSHAPAHVPKSTPPVAKLPPSSATTRYRLGSRTLYVGMYGSDVAALQQLLTQRGFRVGASGSFDSGTSAAVEAAQSAYGLTVDDIVGPMTFGALQSGPPPPPSAQGSPTSSAPCSSSPGAGDSVSRWTPVVNCVLGMLNQPRSQAYVNDVLLVIRFESGGNANAINNWDINAKNGDPSRGLMQVIGTTFNTYRSRALPNDIYDPAANIYAGCAYAISRYGGIPGIPGVRAVNNGGQYVGYRARVRRRRRWVPRRRDRHG